MNASQKLILDKNLFDTRIRLKLETLARNCSLNMSTLQTFLAKLPNLFNFLILAVNQHNIFTFGLGEEQLKRDAINSRFHGQIGRFAANFDFDHLFFVLEHLAILTLQVFKSIILLYVRLLFHYVRNCLLHLRLFLLIKFNLFFLFSLFALVCHEKLSLVHLPVIGQTRFL